MTNVTKKSTHFYSQVNEWIKLQCMFIQWNVHNYNNDGGNIVCKTKFIKKIFLTNKFFFYLDVWNQHKKQL